MAVSVTSLGHDLYLIDAHMHDEAERLACYLFDTPERVLIECGPSAALGSLFEAIDQLGVDDLATLAITHVHLDHAGAAGHLAERFPNSTIAVHSKGARHLNDPSRLWSSTSRVWGDENMEAMWGPMRPVPADRLRVVGEGDRIRLGRGRSLEVLETPGHAKHHVVFLEDESGGAFVGDAVGIAFPGSDMVQPVTPPPDLDPESITVQLRRLAARDPGFLALAHFGIRREPARVLAEAESRLWEWIRWVGESARGGPEHLADAMRRWVLDGYRALGHSEETVNQYDRNTFWPMQVTGILHWMAKTGRVG
jgi:glyoxylase-like metal-dependent hydrolase (beta-lactamase superfamily II)